MIGMDPHQDAAFDQCMSEKKSDKHGYNGLSNNCTTAAQQCLNAVDIPVPKTTIFPQDLQDALWRSGAVVDVYGYPAE